ncbi:MAG: hypothetical protein WC757_00670 [Candidatus Paceibacterota bacterium]|jgi:hypothetical protein
MKPETYHSLKKSAVIIFIACIVIFAIVTIVAIWGAFDRDVVGKSFYSLLVISAGLFFVVGAGYVRIALDVKPVLSIAGKTTGMPTSLKVILWIVGIIFLVPMFFQILGRMMY